MKLVISDSHKGLKATARRVMGTSWQSFRVHCIRNALAYVDNGQQSMVSGALRGAFIQPDRGGASQTLRHTADQHRAKGSKRAVHINDSAVDVLAHSVVFTTLTDVILVTLGPDL